MMPPKAVEMGGCGNNVRFAIAINIVSEHIRAIAIDLFDVWNRMELPRRDSIGLFRLLPPAVGDHDVDTSIAVDVAVAQAVRETSRARNFFPFLTGFADRNLFPGLRWILSRREIAHLTLVIFAGRLPAHHQNLLALAEQVDVNGSFV